MEVPAPFSSLKPKGIRSSNREENATSEERRFALARRSVLTEGVLTIMDIGLRFRGEGRVEAARLGMTTGELDASESFSVSVVLEDHEHADDRLL